MNVRIRYLYRDPLAPVVEARYVVSGATSLESAKQIIESGHYLDASIVLDEEGWPPFVEGL